MVRSCAQQSLRSNSLLSMQQLVSMILHCSNKFQHLGSWDAAFYCTSAEAASLVAMEVCLPETALHYFDKARYHLSSMFKKR